MSPRARLLFVSDVHPWPTSGGGRLRVAALVEELAKDFDVDLFTMAGTPPLDDPPAEPALRRWTMGPRPTIATGVGPRARWLVSRQPFEVVQRDPGPTREAFAAWAEPRYDAIWFERPDVMAWLQDLVEGPTIVDYPNLEAEKVRQSSDVRSGAGSPAGRARQAFGAARMRMDVRRWERFERDAAARADAVVVCSEADRQRLGRPDTFVVPNGYRSPSPPLGRPTAGDPPTLLFAGWLRYTPNADAARHLVLDVLPELRALVPDARVRLVGHNDERITSLAGDGVEVTGFVPSMDTELAQADLLVVPMRIGSGTRLKILEAFAHRIPVVSTTVGCDGIDARHGEHLLVADEPAELASACASLLADVDLRVRLTDAAARLHQDRYRWESIGRAAVDVVARVVGARDPA